MAEALGESDTYPKRKPGLLLTGKQPTGPTVSGQKAGPICQRLFSVHHQGNSSIEVLDSSE